MLSMIRDLRQTLKLKALIMESFVPMAEIQNTQERAVWDAEEDEWRILGSNFGMVGLGFWVLGFGFRAPQLNPE